MITADGPVVAAFRSVGWTWGGGWSSPTDLMHFSSTGH
jgi:D-alanyl-D-alanine carboxypeptidase